MPHTLPTEMAFDHVHANGLTMTTSGSPSLRGDRAMTASGAEVVRVAGLSKVFGKEEASVQRRMRGGAVLHDALALEGASASLDDVTLSVSKGEIFVIMGLSGSGKSTLVRCINGLIRPTSGTAVVEGVDICTSSAAELRQLRQFKMAMVFQSFALLPHMTVTENVEFGLMLRGDASGQRSLRARQVLEMVGLGAWQKRQVGELSGGMRQRVGLARALATDPDILIMDEPFSALDPLIRRSLQDELLRLQKELRMTILFVTHDFAEATRIGSRIAIMKSGNLVQAGRASELFINPCDDYVREFTAHIDCLQLLTVADLVERVPTLVDESLTNCADRAVQINDSDPVASLVQKMRIGSQVCIHTNNGRRLIRAEYLWEQVGRIYEVRKEN